MTHYSSWMIVAPVAVGLLGPTLAQPAQAADPGGHAPGVSKKAHKLEPIPGSKLKRVILTPKAAERLGIAAGAVREQEVVRKRTFPGQIVAARPEVTPTAGGAAPNGVAVRVPVTGDVSAVARDQPARVLPLAAKGHAAALTAKPVEVSAVSDAGKAFYYVVEGANGLSPGQPVTVELPVNGNGTKRTVVPYSATFYDEHGQAWVYTNPAPLTYVREPIVVDFYQGDLAVLSKGPAAGTTIVTVGASELFGAETGVGH
jgi:hypothetical protein